PEVAADEAQLRQALLNLVRNAREAMVGTPGRTGAGARLRVAVIEGTRTDAGEVRVRIEDSGPGIAGDNLGKLFDPFFSPKERGPGLGLALVQEIIIEHGGRIDVDSTPGVGTTFTLTFAALPARAGAAPPAAEEGDESPSPAAEAPLAKPA